MKLSAASWTSWARTDAVAKAGVVRSPLGKYLERLQEIEPAIWRGQVAELVGLLVESNGPGGAVGDICEIQTASGGRKKAQVVGFRGGRLLLMPMEETEGIQLGDRVVLRAEAAQAAVGPALLGRTIDAFGKPLDSGGAIEAAAHYNLYAPAPGPMEREPISEPLITGIRAIDSLLPCGRGQRIGIFGGSGVGQEHFARYDGAAEFGRRGGDCANWRAQSRGAGIYRAGTGAGGDAQERRGGGDV